MNWSQVKKGLYASDDLRFCLRRTAGGWDVIERGPDCLPYKGTRRTLAEAKSCAEFFARLRPTDHFALQNDAPKPKPATFDNAKATQRKLLDGLDLLPGQQDLF